MLKARRLSRAKVVLASLLLIGVPLSIMAQPAPAPAADPALDAAAKAYDALPEAERKAIQDGLVWAGDYKGAVDGRFGKGTRDAINAFAQRSKLPVTGMLDDKGRAALAAVTRQAQKNWQFVVQSDARAGVRIGIPTKLLSKSSSTKSGTRYTSPDGKYAVETSSRPDSATVLADEFEAAKADAPGRKVTYKVLRPDFFVVSGEKAGEAFYIRMTRNQSGTPPTVVGFTTTFPSAAKAQFEPISLAIANSFESSTGAAMPSSALSPAASATPAVAAPPKPGLVATGVVVGPGLVATSLPKDACADLRVGTQSAKILKRAGDLVLLSADIKTPGLPLANASLADSSAAATLFYVPKSDVSPAAELVAAGGDIRIAGNGAPPRLRAPLQGPIAGSVVLDRSGTVLGLLPAPASAPQVVAGVVPQRFYAFIAAAEIAAFSGVLIGQPTAGPDKTIGEIATKSRTAVLPIACRN